MCARPLVERLRLHASAIGQDKGYTLLTFPKVPSAISCTTVYSPSFDGGMTEIGSCSLIVAVIVADVALDKAGETAKISLVCTCVQSLLSVSYVIISFDSPNQS